MPYDAPDCLTPDYVREHHCPLVLTTEHQWVSSEGVKPILLAHI